MKIAEEGLYKMLVTCIKETTWKGFHNVQAAWNVKASERGFHKGKSHTMQKMQEHEIARWKQLGFKKKQCKDFARYKSHDPVENKKQISAKWVSEDFCLSEMVSVLTWSPKIKFWSSISMHRYI